MSRLLWYFTAPKYREALGARVAADRVEVGNGTIESAGAPLVEAGAVAEARWRRGKLVASTSLDALIAAARTDELRHVAQEGAQGAWLKLAGTADAATVYLMVAAFGDNEPARARLRSRSEKGTVAALCETAKAWKHLLADGAEAERLLKDAEARSASSADLVAVAEAWMSVTGDKAALKRCLQAAESRAATLDDVLTSAAAWARLADDGTAAHRGIDRARGMGEDTATRLACVRALRTILDEEAAQKGMKEIEARARDGADWAACALSQLEVFGDEAEFKRCLEQAIKLNGWRHVAAVWHQTGDLEAARATLEDAESRADALTLAGCAATWKEVLGDVDRGRRCLERAESRADGTKAWAECAATWKRVFGDENQMRRCLGEMEKHAKETLEWCECAAYSIDAGNTEAAKHCLAKGQEAAKASADFIAQARVWNRLQSVPDVARSLDEADKRAEDVSSLVQVAEAWKDLGADEKKARAALAKAEQGAAEKGGWSQIAHAWARGLGDQAAARRCLAEAERRATEASHWAALGTAFDRILDDANESRRCRVKAMEMEAGDDVSACARGWRRILDDEEAKKRLHAREAGTAGVEAWEKLRDAWRGVFGDEAEAHRCDEWVGRWRTVQTAMDAGDWTAYAKTWREILNDDAEAKKRLKAVEENAASLKDWAAFAKAWKVVFEDDGEARRCMEGAESKARFKSDWKQCAEAWREIGQYNDQQRCLSHR